MLIELESVSPGNLGAYKIRDVPDTCGLRGMFRREKVFASDKMNIILQERKYKHNNRRGRPSLSFDGVNYILIQGIGVDSSRRSYLISTKFCVQADFNCT